MQPRLEQPRPSPVAKTAICEAEGLVMRTSLTEGLQKPWRENRVGYGTSAKVGTVGEEGGVSWPSLVPLFCF